MTAQNGTGSDPVQEIVDQLALQLATFDEREVELLTELTRLRQGCKGMRQALRALAPEHPRAQPPRGPGSAPQGGKAKKGHAAGKEYPVKADSLQRVWAWVMDQDGAAFPQSQAIYAFESMDPPARLKGGSVTKSLEELRDVGALRLAGEMRRSDQKGGQPSRAFKLASREVGDGYVSERLEAAVTNAS